MPVAAGQTWLRAPLRSGAPSGDFDEIRCASQSRSLEGGTTVSILPVATS
ncbi:hypothetical protein FHT29_000737 [Rhizobium sp. SG741]|nr:hypothetical protein [Rhizobium sp. SG741]